MSQKRKSLDRVLAFVLSVIMVVAMFPVRPAFAIGITEDYASVTTLTGGTVNGNETENVEVLVEETALNWVEANSLRSEGWWVGIKVEAPAGFSDDATYKRKSNPNAEYGSEMSFATAKDGENHIELWFPVSPESLNKFKSENRNLTMVYAFDWDADTTYEQEITFSVVPSEKIVLMKGSVQVYPVDNNAIAINGYTGVYDGNAHTATVSVEGYTVKYSENNVDFSETALSSTGESSLYFSGTEICQ